MKPFPAENSAAQPCEVEVTAQLTVDTGVRLIRLIRHLVRENGTAPVSFDGLRTLAFLGDHPGICLSDLADFLWVGLPTASKQVDDLVEKQVVCRSADATDRRRVALTLTPAGEQLVATARRPAQEAIGTMIGRLSPEERERLRDGLTILRRLLTERERADA